MQQNCSTVLNILDEAEKFASGLSGHYRVRSSTHYAHIKRDPGNARKWMVTIHNKATGDLKRYGGIWDNLKDAEDEAVFILATPEYR
jgi:hypothetical protein